MFKPRFKFAKGAGYTCGTVNHCTSVHYVDLMRLARNMQYDFLKVEQTFRRKDIVCQHLQSLRSSMGTHSLYLRIGSGTANQAIEFARQDTTRLSFTNMVDLLQETSWPESSWVNRLISELRTRLIEAVWFVMSTFQEGIWQTIFLTTKLENCRWRHTCERSFI